MNILQQLMVITMEECAELTQQCSKTMRKYETIEEANADDQKAIANRNKLVEEAGDVLCMLQLMVEHKMVTWDELEIRAKVKKEKLKKWSDLV
jgi:NTP pyrophosphatase (non-canonical NTP hydrolase)